ncbi:synaptotagmin-2-like isoform X1 [Micractinium conductrix]|uniref:Synaptotagmin-2-like isoform X1 n=1 Tax=Micractinium conductrix TaxID=554055 RepID=A0A2P6VIU8_9CHLO|nr:synaptotagmin-2-like isoform X1 [Micractinium conductrix]|eukprot:PSC73977.1 synaptotagmin-2-like isoform X1 [Micractinium conductrix]
MVLAWLAGAALGSAGGVALGATLLDKVQFAASRKDYLRTVDYTADDDDDVPMPQTAGQPVSFLKKQVLRNTSPWLTNPDYDRLLFINTILTALWPHLSPAIHKMAMEQAKAPLNDVCEKAKILKEIRIDRLDLGTRPPRVDCFKSYKTAEDELIVETPAFWGGDMSVRVTAVVKVGSKTIDVPVDVGNIQFKALTRITIKPLVETLPCLGGVTVSLLETPHFDMDFRLCDSPDIMALPGVPLAVTSAISIIAGKMLVYPNEFSLPLMPNFGLPPPPMGMLHVKVIGATGLKSSLFDRMDPFVLLRVRDGRHVQTSTLTNTVSPQWNEYFDFVVDDPKKQALRLILKDDDLVSASTEGEAVVVLDGADFIANPRTPRTLNLPLHVPADDGLFGLPGLGLPGGKKPKERKPLPPGSSPGASPGGCALTGGELQIEVTYFPFASARPEVAPAAAAGSAPAEGAAAGDTAAPTISSVRRVLAASSVITRESKGVLTMTLKKAMNLGGSPDSYAEITLYDPNRKPVPNIEYKTEVVLNESSPRYNFTTDFVNISAASSLTIVIYDKPGAMAALTSLKVPFLQKAKATALGRVRLAIEDVAKEGRVSDRYALLEAQTGEVHLNLAWNPIELVDEPAMPKDRLHRVTANMGNCLQKAKTSDAMDKGIDAAAKNKTKVASGVKSAAVKAGLDEKSAQKVSQGVEQMLANKEDLKASVHKAMGDTAAPAATDATDAPAATDAVPA